jgi:cysteine synthase A
MGSLDFLRDTDADGYLQVSGEEAMQMTRRLAAEEGIFAGFSSGANVAAALQLLKGPMEGKTIVVLLCDSGLKYMSTGLWES